MPSFSTQVTNHEGDDILEILCDQNPWGDTYTYDEHFRFGPFKARMIVAAQSVISEFAESHGAKPPRGVIVTPRDDHINPSLSPRCSTYDHFFVRNHRVDRPYLKLSVGHVGYGFGVSKAEALLVMMDQVKVFAWSHPA